MTVLSVCAGHSLGKIGVRLRSVVVPQIPCKQSERLSVLVRIRGQLLVPLVVTLLFEALPAFGLRMC